MKSEILTPHTVKILSIMRDLGQPVLARAVLVKLYDKDAVCMSKRDHAGVEGRHRHGIMMMGGQLGKLQKKGLVKQYRDMGSGLWLWEITEKGRLALSEALAKDNGKVM